MSDQSRQSHKMGACEAKPNAIGDEYMMDDALEQVHACIFIILFSRSISVYSKSM